MKFIVRSVFFVAIILTILSSNIHKVYAVPSNQIIRTFGLQPRSVEEARKKRKQESTEREDIDQEPYNAFHIYDRFKCDDKSIIDFDTKALSEETLITADILDTPLAFATFIEVIKAHLEIVLRTFRTKGINFDLEKYPLRYHHSREQLAYPMSVAIEPETVNAVHYPDTVRSAVYIYYVITPVLKEFMTDYEYKLYQDMLSIISFRDVIELKKPVTLHKYDNYFNYVQTFCKLLDIIEKRFLKKFEKSRNDAEFQQEILLSLVKSNWLAYLSVISCPMVSLPIDPSVDVVVHYEPPVVRDNYLLGMGFFERLKKLSNKYNKQLNAYQKKSLKMYIDFYSQFYQEIEPPHHQENMYNDMRHVYSEAVCSLDINDDSCHASN